MHLRRNDGVHWRRTYGRAVVFREAGLDITVERRGMRGDASWWKSVFWRGGKQLRDGAEKRMWRDSESGGRRRDE
jgi:hypothetical protein